jgi:hypothetical protein
MKIHPLSWILPALFIWWLFANSHTPRCAGYEPHGGCYEAEDD